MKVPQLTHKTPSLYSSAKPIAVMLLALGALALSSCADTPPIKPTATVMIGTHQSL